MNWCDWVALGIIFVFGFIGLINGFIFSVFRLASFIISIFLSIKLYPVIASILMKTQLFFSIKNSVFKSLMRRQLENDGASGSVGQAASGTADNILGGLPLPGFLKEAVIKHLDLSKVIDVSKIMDTISGELAKIIVDIISLVLIYILIRLGLVFVRFILQGIAKLPVFKQINKLGGFALGLVEGLLTIYIICAILTLFHTSQNFAGIFAALDNSLIAKYFYEHNFIIDWMFLGKKTL